MVNIPPELEVALETRARALRRPIANYIELLITQDLRPDLLAEDPGPYAVTRDVVLPMVAGAEAQAASPVAGGRATVSEIAKSNPPRPTGPGRGKART